MSDCGKKLLNLIPKNKEWILNRESEEMRRNGSCSDENKKLELRLGLPGDEDCFRESYFPDQKQGFSTDHHYHPWPCSGYQTQPQQQKMQQKSSVSPYLHNHQYQTSPKGLPVMAKESSHPCCTRIVDLQKAEKKAFSPSSANTAVPNSSQKRAAPAPVVGWPPIRSFRKNLASTSSSSAKPVSEPENVIPSKLLNEKPGVENSHKGLFVKINMDGVPIGRKIDLNAYDSYGKLSSAVDELFRGLLAAQRESSVEGDNNKQVEQKPITGLMDGSGEYTLVYEDNEGDRILVGDVPWHMFVATVKRLRVLKSSELPTLSRGGSKAGKVVIESAPK